MTEIENDSEDTSRYSSLKRHHGHRPKSRADSPSRDYSMGDEDESEAGQENFGQAQPTKNSKTKNSKTKKGSDSV